MVPVTSMFAATSGKPRHSAPVCRRRKARLTSTALRVLSVERLGRMRTSLKSSLTSVSMRMDYPDLTGEARALAGLVKSYHRLGPERMERGLGFENQGSGMSEDLIFYTNPMSRGRIARWMLEEVDRPYRTEILEFADSMKAPEY